MKSNTGVDISWHCRLSRRVKQIDLESTGSLQTDSSPVVDSVHVGGAVCSGHTLTGIGIVSSILIRTWSDSSWREVSRCPVLRWPTLAGASSVNDCGWANDRSGDVFFWFVRTCFEVIEVLTRVCGLVFAALDKPKESRSNKGTQDGSKPVDPMFRGKVTVGYTRSETSSRVQGATSVVYACNGLAEPRKHMILVLPANSAMNKDRPIPTGAMKVPLCFSACESGQ